VFLVILKYTIQLNNLWSSSLEIIPYLQITIETLTAVNWLENSSIIYRNSKLKYKKKKTYSSQQKILEYTHSMISFIKFADKAPYQ
jgi:hypothetical protein